MAVRQPHVAAGCRGWGHSRVSLYGLVPSLSERWLGFFIVAGMAVLFGVLGFIGKAFTKIIAMVLGFIAGGAVVIGFMNLLNIGGVSFWVWICALLGGLIGAGLFSRFMDWGLIIFASLIGSMLLVRGAMKHLPSLNGTYGSVVIVVLTILGIFYHARKLK